MARLAHLVFHLILVAGIVLAAGYGSFMRAAQAMSNAGSQTFVICGGDGARTVTLDARGNPVEPEESQVCAHCADCSLAPVATLATPGVDAHCPAAAKSEPMPTTIIHPRTARLWMPSRGAPNQCET